MKLFLLVAIFLISSCSSGPFREPPSGEIIKSLKMGLGKKEDFLAPQKISGERQAYEFLKADFFLKNKNFRHACLRFEYLSKDSTFALKKLAWIKSLKSCDYSSKDLIKIWESKKNDLPSWLQEEYLKSSLEVSKNKKLKKYEAIFLAQTTKYKKLRSEKIEIIQEALEIASGAGEKELATELTDKFHKLAPRFKKRIDPKERFQVAKDFEKVREFDKARSYYRKIIRDPSVDINAKKTTWNRLRLSYKLQRQKPTYVEKTKKMVDFFREKLESSPKDKRLKKIWVNSSIKYARALWTLHQRDKGRKILNNLITYGVTDADFRTQIHWVLGNMKKEEKKYTEAIEQFEIASEFDSNDKSLKEKIIWSVGWNYFLLENYEKTIKHFTHFIESSDSFAFKIKMKFWIAKSLRKQGKESKAKKIFRELSNLDPFGFYGIVSNMELGNPFNPIKIERRDDHYEDLTLNWLLALDEKDLAKSYLKSIQGKFKTTEQINDLLPLYEKVEWFEGGIFKFFKIKAEDRTVILEENAASAFPIPFKELAAKAGKRFSLPPALIFSIIRQESAFNPVIRSWADAFGLMQLTPERAKELASRYPINYKELDNLFDPQINIQLGAALLGELKHKFKDNFIHFVASYNASESVVSNWFRRNWDGDPLKFIEMIPYEETQGYVKLVFRNMVSYRRLLTSDSFYLKPEVFTDLKAY